jgi:hydrogenase maturation protease
MKKILIVGLGNVLLQDEGIGIHVLERLEKERHLWRHDHVELIRGETGALALLPSLAEASAIIFVDAADFDGEAGEIRVFRGSEIQTERYMPLSVHDVGLRDLISLIVLKNPSPPEIVVVGIKPLEFRAGVEISSELHRAVPFIIMMIRAEVTRLALDLFPKKEHPKSLSEV